MLCGPTYDMRPSTYWKQQCVKALTRLCGLTAWAPSQGLRPPTNSPQAEPAPFWFAPPAVKAASLPSADDWAKGGGELHRCVNSSV